MNEPSASVNPEMYQGFKLITEFTFSFSCPLQRGGAGKSGYPRLVYGFSRTQYEGNLP
jgi:hypothetical protein